MAQQFENIIKDIQVLKTGTSQRKDGTSFEWILRGLVSEEEDDNGKNIKYTTFDNHYFTPDNEKVMITDAIIGKETSFCYEVDVSRGYENRKIITNPASPSAQKENKLDRILKGVTMIWDKLNEEPAFDKKGEIIPDKQEDDEVKDEDIPF